MLIEQGGQDGDGSKRHPQFKNAGQATRKCVPPADGYPHHPARRAARRQPCLVSGRAKPLDEQGSDEHEQNHG